jgi:hypothetical protein
MSVTKTVENLQARKNDRTSGYQDASRKFDSLVKRGLVSKRAPVEVGRGSVVNKVYTYCNSNELKK